jgi:excisionase family DNA binding protein
MFTILWLGIRVFGVTDTGRKKTMESNQRVGKADAALPQPPNNFGQQWLTASEAAAYLNVKPATLLGWARQGKVRGYMLSGTHRHVWRFRICDLDGMLLSPSIALGEKIQ